MPVMNLRINNNERFRFCKVFQNVKRATRSCHITLNIRIDIPNIQRMPTLFGTLRVLVDRPQNSARFLILGCASPALVKNVSETLAGRVEFIELSGFDIRETGTDSGILHALLNIVDSHSLFGHPRAGASWEGFALQHLWIIYPGQYSYPVDERISFWPLQLISELTSNPHARGEHNEG